MIKTRVTIGGTDYNECSRCTVNVATSTFATVSDFDIRYDNRYGDYSDKFSINDEVLIYADKDAEPTTKMFSGVIEAIKFSGRDSSEFVSINGRDYSVILMDILVNPRIFRDTEISEILKSLAVQNLIGTGLTWTNVNATTTTLDKITFNNMSVFDAFNQLAELAGFYFYVDVNKDIHFEEKNAVDSGLVFETGNTISSKFDKADDNLFNQIAVYGDRQLTGAREIFTTGTDNIGSVYVLDAKPFQVSAFLSGASNTQYQPGGILNVSNPEDENVKFLVDYNKQSVVLTSGTTAGNNIAPTGSVIIIDYQRSTPIISIKNDVTSIATYGLKQKNIFDRNIKDLNEANSKATSFLAEHINPTQEGTILLNDVLSVTPGQTAFVNLPHFNISGALSIINARYEFLPMNNSANRVLEVTMDKRIRKFTDLMKEQELRLRKLEGAEIDTSITNVELATGSIGISGTSIIVSRLIGSAFYFNVTGHDILNSPKSLLGDMRTGSTVITI